MSHHGSPFMAPISELGREVSQFSLKDPTASLTDSSQVPSGTCSINFASCTTADSRRSHHQTSMSSAASSRAQRDMSSLFGHELDEELSQIISQNVSFEGAHHLMRAVRLSRVMMGMASIFKDSKGSAATYDLSEHATSVRYFLSHNWCVSRWDKWMALNLKFNENLALTFTILFCLLCGILSSYDLQPTIHDHGFDTQTGCICRLLCCPLAFIVFSFGSTLTAYLGRRGPLVFLDKVCIHQTDTSLQQAGIQRLGAFLRISDQLLVLYSEVYLRKLWTILEVANFLALHAIEDIQVVPVMLPRLMFAAFPIAYILVGIVMVASFLDVPRDIQYPITFVAGFVYSFAVRRWSRHKVKMQERLKTFEVRKCSCTLESDREVIYAKIADLMRVRGIIGRHASVEEGLQAFDTMVRKQMPQAFSIIFQSGSLTYKNYLFVACMLVLPSNMDHIMLIHNGSTLQEVEASAVRDALWMFSIWPLALFLLEVIASKNLHWRRWKQFVYLFSITIFITMLFTSIHLAITALEERASTDDLSLQIFLALTTVIILLTWLVVAIAYRWTPCRSWKIHDRRRKQRRALSDLRKRQSEHAQKEGTTACATSTTTVEFNFNDSDAEKKGGASWWTQDMFTLPAPETILL